MVDPQVFIVRVWSAGGDASGFHAIVRAVEQEAFSTFRQPEALAAFFAAVATGAVLARPSEKTGHETGR